MIIVAALMVLLIAATGLVLFFYKSNSNFNYSTEFGFDPSPMGLIYGQQMTVVDNKELVFFAKLDQIPNLLETILPNLDEGEKKLIVIPKKMFITVPIEKLRNNVYFKAYIYPAGYGLKNVWTTKNWMILNKNALPSPENTAERFPKEMIKFVSDWPYNFTFKSLNTDLTIEVERLAEPKNIYPQPKKYNS